MTDKYRKWLPPIGSDFLTITLNPTWYSRKAVDQFKQSKEMVKQILKKFSDNFCMIAELTKQGNVHYHGWIVYNNLHETTRVHVLDCLKVLGLAHIKEDTIKNIERVYEYMTKQVKYTNEFISNPIVKYKKKMREYPQIKDGCKPSTFEEGRRVTSSPPMVLSITEDQIINALDIDLQINTVHIEVP